MKRTILLVIIFYSVGIFAYTSEDLENASKLSNKGYINIQYDKSKYRLDDKILRQEIVAIALRIKGIDLPGPQLYSCQKYFADAIKNDWVCVALELAANNGILSRENKNARPGDFVTRAEALGILYKVKYGTAPSGAPILPFIDAYEGWIGDVVIHTYLLGIISNKTDNHFYPNKPATRAEVFAFAQKIIEAPANVTEGNFVGENIGQDLGWGYTKDNQHVYKDGVILSGIDPGTFQLFEYDYLADKSGVFKYFRDNGSVYKIPNIDKKTFKILNASFVKDNTHAYHCDGFGVEIGNTKTYQARQFMCKGLSVDIKTFFCQGINSTTCEDKTYFYNLFDEKKKKETLYKEILISFGFDAGIQQYLALVPQETTPIALVSDLSKKYSDITQKKIIQNIKSGAFDDVINLETIQSGTLPRKIPIKLRNIGTNTVIVIKAEAGPDFDNWLEADFIHKNQNGYEIFTSKIQPYGFLEKAEKMLGYSLSQVLESFSQIDSQEGPAELIQINNKLSALFNKTLELYLEVFTGNPLYYI